MNFSKIKTEDELEKLYPECIVHYRNNENWKINVFFYLKDKGSIENNWESLSSSISAIYQSKLIGVDDEFERWNFYTIYLCSEDLGKQLKNKIENNRFSSRKIVEDNFTGQLDDLTANDLIVKHITNTDLIQVIEETKSTVDEEYVPLDKNLWKLIPKSDLIIGDIEKQKVLFEKLKSIQNEDKKS